MTLVMLFGGGSRTGLAIRPDGVEVFATPDDAAERIGATAAAMGRIADARTLVGERLLPDSGGTLATLAGTVFGELRAVTPDLDERATVVYVDGDSGVLATPDGTVHALPVRVRGDAAATLATLAKTPAVRGPDAGEAREVPRGMSKGRG